MSWNSSSEFFAMGGYGLYVWGSLAVTAKCLILETFFIHRRRRAALTQLQSESVLEQELLNEKSS
ncbi:heme exporter protein CcmD [Delftia tsuruhatensis]|jgi:heme exporter protein D|uniref:heme exporter protein CcmD n=1 Tax=Delftia tsuruhatensis TaxID=180282 RepID=UPI00338FF69A